MHELRDANGILKAKLDNVATHKILEGAIGHWRAYRSASKPHVKMAFELDEDGVYTTRNGNGIRLFLWKGDIIVAE